LSHVYTDNAPTYASHYLWDRVLPLIPHGARVIDIGCGNGALVNELRSQGRDALGVDTSESGARMGGAHCYVGSAYDDLVSRFGRFDVVVSLEVIEHLYDPRRFVRVARDLLRPDGLLIVSTPFHGYWKNLALALSGRLDDHFTALWDGGHIKFWSERTLSRLLTDEGFAVPRFVRAGRFGPFAKSMIAVTTRA
jgi:2-polyprenyl-3-methyl-5-hydroxy-6-metoxy-1,4-benzoquinol methylase